MKSILIILLFLTVNGVAWAQKPPVFVTDNGAIHGYDPVAFFTEQKAVPGSKEITYEWNGASWHFASEENKRTFISDPEKYTPQYGGYCAFGMSRGYKAPTQPDAWSIVNGKLYFNYNKDVQKEWTKSRDEFMRKADEQWPTVSKN